ncbi:MAG: M1 family aminopeptidase, partial [Maribacter sp.]
MSTYLFSFVAGKFEAVRQKQRELEMTLLYRESDDDKISFSIDSIFNLHQQAISYLETYTDTPFPFQKLDFAAIPGFQYGGMEHIGAIQYREDALFLDESATQNKILSRAKLIAHETAHMWFGDLVTMAWFNDVWMKEVFANFMADKVVNPAFPEINHQLAFITTHYPNAYGEDRTLGTNPIRQDLDNLNNAGSLYGSIIYNKAPIMMRQLERLIGEEAFKIGIQEYIQKFAYGNAVWNDLITLLDEKTNADVAAWSDVWVNSSGRPVFSDSIVYNADDTISSLSIQQKAEDNSAHIWPQAFEIALVYSDTVQRIKVDMSNSNVQLTEAIGLPKPNFIVYNSNAEGYGVFPVQPDSVSKITSLSYEVLRGYAYINAYENMLIGKIDATTAMALFREGLATETNALLLNLIANYTTSLFWIYLTDQQQIDYQRLLTEQLWSQLQLSLSPTIKKTLFNTYRALGYTGVARDHLYTIWSRDIEISNLKLNADDDTELAMDLALFGHEAKMEILETAKNAITNPDKLERFQFLQPSLSGNTAQKMQFFESLKQEEHRAKESWVITALDNLNHPVHQQESIRNLRQSLDLLDEIQKTGDIFFPKRWLSSTLGTYNSAEAYHIVQDFLSDNPDLNPSLKLKILQASDDLRRVHVLNKKIDKSVN